MSRTELLERTNIPKTTLHDNIKQLKEKRKLHEEMEGGESFCSLPDSTGL